MVAAFSVSERDTKFYLAWFPVVQSSSNLSESVLLIWVSLCVCYTESISVNHELQFQRDELKNLLQSYGIQLQTCGVGYHNALDFGKRNHELLWRMHIKSKAQSLTISAK